MFPILTHAQLVEKIRSFDAIKYCKTRNYLNGWISKLSPYITHGIITIDEIVKISLEKYTIDQAESWYKELLWREYFVQVQYHKGNEIFKDIDEDKTHIPKQDILPEEIASKTFASKRVNQTILELETTGYLHNHQRMRLASYMSHRQKLYWKKLADRTYYHFLDGELWSNHLSRQRVQSTFSHKPYFMNEENLQRYLPGTQDPYLRGSYEEVEKRLFDSKRWTDVRNSTDISWTYITDLTSITVAQTSYNNFTILSPWDLHPDKITEPKTTVCILDTDFLTRHPRSQKRITFLQTYCDLYNIELIQWNIHDILKQSTWCTIYETRNPVYRHAYITVWTNHTLHLHQRCSPIAWSQYTKKFFPFWEKSVKHLYSLQKKISKK